MDEVEFIECECGTFDHTLRIGYFEWDAKYFTDAEMYVETHLRDLPLHKRLWYAIRYVCGKKSRYGCFGETVLWYDKVKQLRDMCNRFLDEYGRNTNEATPKKGN